MNQIEKICDDTQKELQLIQHVYSIAVQDVYDMIIGNTAGICGNTPVELNVKRKIEKAIGGAFEKLSNDFENRTILIYSNKI